MQIPMIRVVLVADIEKVVGERGGREEERKGRGERRGEERRGRGETGEGGGEERRGERREIPFTVARKRL